MKVIFPLTGATIPGSLITKDIGEICKMRYGIAAIAFAVALMGSGLVVADPPTPPPGGLKDLAEISGGHANPGTVQRVTEVSPVFGASPTVR